MTEDHQNGTYRPFLPPPPADTFWPPEESEAPDPSRPQPNPNAWPPPARPAAPEADAAPGRPLVTPPPAVVPTHPAFRTQVSDRIPQQWSPNGWSAPPPPDDEPGGRHSAAHEPVSAEPAAPSPAADPLRASIESPTTPLPTLAAIGRPQSNGATPPSNPDGASSPENAADRPAGGSPWDLPPPRPPRDDTADAGKPPILGERASYYPTVSPRATDHRGQDPHNGPTPPPSEDNPGPDVTADDTPTEGFAMPPQDSGGSAAQPPGDRSPVDPRLGQDASQAAAHAGPPHAGPPHAGPPHAAPLHGGPSQAGPSQAGPPHGLPPHGVPNQALPPQAVPPQASPPQAAPPQPNMPPGLDMPTPPWQAGQPWQQAPWQGQPPWQGEQGQGQGGAPWQGGQEQGGQMPNQPWQAHPQQGQPWLGQGGQPLPWQVQGGEAGQAQPWQGQADPAQPWQVQAGPVQPWQGPDSAAQPWQSQEGAAQPWQGPDQAQPWQAQQGQEDQQGPSDQTHHQQGQALPDHTQHGQAHPDHVQHGQAHEGHVQGEQDQGQPGADQGQQAQGGVPWQAQQPWQQTGWQQHPAPHDPTLQQAPWAQPYQQQGPEQQPTDPQFGGPTPAAWSEREAPTADEFLRRRQVKPSEPVAQEGPRAAFNRIPMLPKLPPSRREVERKRDIDMVRRNFGGLRQVTVVNPKGGAGKTVAVLLLAMTFGQNRGGYVLAWDNNETQGTLGMRAQQDFHARTVRDLMRDMHVFRAHGRIGEVSQYVRAQGEGMFDVLASDESATAGEMLTADAFGEIREIVSRFYKLIFVDTGNNVRAQNWQAAMDATDQLVVSMSARNDSAETAARMLDHLEQSGRQRLVRQAISVVSMPPSRKDLDLPAIQRHFAARTRGVLFAPYEKLLDSGEPLRYGQLSTATKEAWLKIAASVAEGL